MRKKGNVDISDLIDKRHELNTALVHCINEDMIGGKVSLTSA